MYGGLDLLFKFEDEVVFKVEGFVVLRRSDKDHLRRSLRPTTAAMM